MPSNSKKQLNFFKLVKSYKKSGLIGFVGMWKEIYGSRPYPERDYLKKIYDTAEKMTFEQLDDFTVGVVGEEPLKQVSPKIGQWALFRSYYIDIYNKEKRGWFLGKITYINDANKYVIFNEDWIYNTRGQYIGSIRKKSSFSLSTEKKYVKFAYYKDIKETSENISNLIKIAEKDKLKENLTVMIRNLFLKS